MEKEIKKENKKEYKSFVPDDDVKTFRAMVLGVLTFVVSIGGSYGGYTVTKEQGKYGVDFEKKSHVVTEVIDGDTLMVEGGIRVRLLGFDAPGLGQCFGVESKQALQDLILGREVFLEKDQKAQDQYGRLLRYVMLWSESPEEDNLFVNDILIKGGYGKSEYIKPNKRYLSLLQASERSAAQQERGMWKECVGQEEQVLNMEREQESEGPEGCVIKGNISKVFSKDYFLPGCPNYKRVIVDQRKGEQWFCSEQEAIDAGWQMSGGCGNIHQFEEGE